MVRSGRCALVSADAAIEEFVRVLGYRKCGLSPEEIIPLVSPQHDVRVITQDIADNLFLSIALEGGCTVIVSGDHHLLDLRRAISRSGLCLQRLLCALCSQIKG
ncbi:MAG: hypothetical protein HZB34_02280 [Nitrospirae bacterium]|nr:hypothetical protein [Nitrospirota bacterium]